MSEAAAEKPSLSTARVPQPGYADLKFYFANLNSLFSIRNMLATDMMTVMPEAATLKRLSDMAAITKRIYAETTSPAVTNLLRKVNEEAKARPEEWEAWETANLSEMNRIHKHLSVLPPDLYVASVQVTHEGRRHHHAALSGQSWSETRQYLEQVVELYRHIASLKQQGFGTRTPYKALLIGYASDISEKQLDALYDTLLEPLILLRDKALQKQASQNPPLPLEGEFSRGDQMWLNKTILEMLGFDFTRGALQITHGGPMAAGSHEDVRVLVRCGDSSDGFLDSMEDTLYQGGRGLYLQNLPPNWETQPVGQGPGAVMLNAQSILYETIIGRTPQFFNFLAVRAEGVFRQFCNKSFDPENLYRLKKVITPSARRNEADELTKIFHDVMRFRIERDLINGTLEVADLPARWRSDSEKYLGITPQSDEEGPQQNPDWFTGRFGFIPTNTLSHIIAATLHEHLYTAIPNFSELIEFGDFKPVNEWLKTHIHSKGRSLDPLKMVETTTGSALSAEPLVQHLTRRYLSDKR